MVLISTTRSVIIVSALLGTIYTSRATNASFLRRPPFSNLFRHPLISKLKIFLPFNDYFKLSTIFNNGLTTKLTNLREIQMNVSNNSSMTLDSETTSIRSILMVYSNHKQFCDSTKIQTDVFLTNQLFNYFEVVFTSVVETNCIELLDSANWLEKLWDVNIFK